MLYTTDPTNPNNNAQDPTVDPNVNADAPAPWDPGAVKTELMQLLDQIRSILNNKSGGSEATAQIQCALFLMQQFGAQRVGQQADLQGNMQIYTDYMSQLMNLLQAGKDDKDLNVQEEFDKPLPFDPKDQKNTIAFIALIDKFIGVLYDKKHANDFPPELRQDIFNQLMTVRNIVKSGSTATPYAFTDHHGLGYLWQQFNSQGGKQGTPTAMDAVMRNMSQVTATCTGQSSIVGGVTKVQMKLYQTESESLNSFIKSMQKWDNLQVSQQKTD